MPVFNIIKQRGISIETPGFKVPIVVFDIPHQAMESLDSKLNSNSILLSLYIRKRKNCNYIHSNTSCIFFSFKLHLRCIYYMTCAIDWFFKIYFQRYIFDNDS